MDPGESSALIGRPVVTRTADGRAWWRALIAVVVAVWASGCLALIVARSSKPNFSPWRASENVSSFFWISDLHIEPIYDYQSPPNADGVCRQSVSLANGCPSASFSAKGGAFPFGRIGCDPPLSLLESMLAKMKSIDSEPPFIILLGDVVAHSLPCPELLQTTFRKVATEITKSFPNTRVIVAVGNIDLYPANHVEIGPDPQLRRIFDAYDAVDWFNTAHLAKRTFTKGGYYTIRPLPGLRVIVYNSMYYTVKLKRWNPLLNVYESVGCGHSNRPDDPLKQLSWMQVQLSRAEKDGEKVYLMSHISPGAKERNYNWCPRFLEAFETLLKRYKSTIVAQFYGDHNRNELRVFYDSSNEPISVSFILPGLTPRRPTLEGSNPVFRQVFFDSSTKALVDFQDYVFPLQEANFKSARGNHKDDFWKALPLYTDDLKLDDMTPSSFAKLVHQFNDNFELLANYINRQIAYSLGNLDAIEFACQTRYLDHKKTEKCSAGNLDPI